MKKQKYNEWKVDHEKIDEELKAHGIEKDSM